MKNLSTKLLIIALFIVAVLSGYNYFHRPFLEKFSQQLPQTEVSEETNEERIEAALAQLSETEQLAQLMSVPVVLGNSEASASTGTQTAVSWIVDHDPGFVTLFGRNLTLEEVSEFTRAVTSDTSGYVPLVAVDHEGGSVQRLRGDGFSLLPAWRQNCQADSAERTTVFSQSASELQQAGIHIVFAPVLDVARSGSFIGNRACSTEDEAVSTASDFILSFAQHGILSVAKHFPGIGGVTVDLHTQPAVVTIEARDTLPFERVLQTFPNIGVMTTHVAVENRTDNMPCSLSTVCLSHFSLHFPEALLFTDALEMDSAGIQQDGLGEKTLPARAVQAIAAGNDVLVFGETVTLAEIEEVMNALKSEYDSNEIFRQRVETSVQKVLELKLPQPTE